MTPATSAVSQRPIKAEASASDPMIDTFIDALWLEEGLSKNTLEAYRRDLKLFGVSLAATAKTLVATTEQHIQT